MFERVEKADHGFAILPPLLVLNQRGTVVGAVAIDAAVFPVEAIAERVLGQTATDVVVMVDRLAERFAGAIQQPQQLDIVPVGRGVRRRRDDFAGLSLGVPRALDIDRRAGLNRTSNWLSPQPLCFEIMRSRMMAITSSSLRAWIGFREA